MTKGEKKMSYAVKVSLELRRKVKKFCDERGIKQSFFVEVALREKIEREESLLEDIIDLKTLRQEEKLAIPFEKYLEKR